MSTDRVDGFVAQFRACLKDPAQPFALLVRIPVRAGTEAKFEAAFATAMAVTRREPGVLRYELNRETADGTRYVVYERWKSLADLEAHLRSPYITKLMAVTDEVIAAAPEFHVLLPAAEVSNA